MKKLYRNPYFYLILFLIINILQAVLTPISKDEAYYWMYSQQLDWGYFDHPPLVGLIIYLSDLLFNGVLGVRLMSTILTTLTLWVIWKMLPTQDREKRLSVPLFFTLAFALPVFNIYGFITTPDVPLLFFSALYLLVFLRFMEDNSLQNAMKLGVVAALLMYSKYHGAFVIIFSILAHYKLLWNRYFYLSGLVAVILYVPHILWQVDHNFASIRYHLYQRTDGFMGGKHIVDYILNAFAILNPFLFGYYLYYLISKHFKSNIDRVFSVLMWGFILFFGFTSFRDHIEPQWIGVASISLLVILFHLVVNADVNQKVFRSFIIVSLVLIMVARVSMVLPLPLKTEFHRQQASYYKTIQKKAGSDRLVFVNTYYDAAKYTFYTGDPAFSYNCYDYRKNQYDLWNYEDIYQNSSVYFISGYKYPWTDSTLTLEGIDLNYKRIPEFPMINKCTATWESVETIMENGSKQVVEIELYNPYDYPLEFNHPTKPLRFFAIFELNKIRTVFRMETDHPAVLNPGKKVRITGSFSPELKASTYKFAIGLQPLKISPVLVTEKVDVEVP